MFGGKKGGSSPGGDDRSTYTPLNREGTSSTKLDKKSKTALETLLNCPEEQGLVVIEQVASKRPEIYLPAYSVAKASLARVDSQASIERVHSRMAMSPGQSNLPMLQFSCPKYFCLEEEPSVTLEVMRLHGGNQTSKVSFKTQDGTAVAGKAYQATSGELIFGPHEKQKTIVVSLIDDVRWGGITEFQVILEEESLHNSTLSKYLSTARVQRIEDDTFPSNKHKQEILGRKLEDIDGKSLMFEYFKHNFADPIIRCGTFKLVFLGQLRNCNFLFGLFAKTFMIDYVLVGTHGSGRSWHPIGPITTQKLALLVLIAINLLPILILHILDYLKFTWKVAGRARLITTGGLMNAFLNYNEASRTEIDAGALVEAMTTDTELIIKTGYINFIQIFQVLGQIGMCIVFQAAAPLAFGSPTRGLTMLQMTLYPVVMMIALTCRLNVTRVTLTKSIFSKRRTISHVNELVQCYRLIADFNQRFLSQDKLEADVKTFNADDTASNQVVTNNSYVVTWLSGISVGIYTLVGGMDVIDHKIPLGVFLTTLGVIVQIGDLWNHVYATVLDTLESLSALIRVVDFMNLPSDTRDRMVWARLQTKATQQGVSSMNRVSGMNMQLDGEPGQSAIMSSVDALNITISNLRITLQTKDLLNKGVIYRETQLLMDKFRVGQGQLVALVGKSGKGKSTLLKLLGGAILPHASDDGKSIFFIPSHLRVLHVPTEIMFIKETLYFNLTYGVMDRSHPDARLSRVIAICRRLGLNEKVISHISTDSQHEIAWSESVSVSEQHLLALARALIANPELLCIHKPTLHGSAESGQKIVEILREYVDKRGLEEDENQFRLRRPRTCIVTSTRAKSLAMMDEVYKVCAVDDSNGHHIIPIDKAKVNSELTLEDFC